MTNPKQAQPPAFRVAGYVRVSSPKQAQEEKVSLEEQRTDIEAYCQSKGYSIVLWYSDVGSAASKNRKRFREMLKAAREKSFDGVVCWKSDRLSRGIYSAVPVMECVEETGIKIEAVKDVIDMKTFAILAAVGKIELDNLRDRVKMGTRGKAKNGDVWPDVPFGYGREDQRPVVNEAEAAEVRRIFQRYLSGLSCMAIATALNEEGVPTRKGGLWRHSTVWDILTETAYTGTAYYGKRAGPLVVRGEEDRRVWQKTDPSTWIEVPYPRIIEGPVWEAVQKMRKHHGRERLPRLPAVFMLEGKLWCGSCGCRYTTEASYRVKYRTRKDGSRVRKKTENIMRRYCCLSRNRTDRSCPHKRVYASTIESWVWGKIDQFFKRPESVQKLMGERQQALADAVEPGSIQRAKKRGEEVEAERARVVLMYQKGYINEADLDVRLKGIDERLEYFQDELKRLESESASITETLVMLQDFLSASQSIAERLDTMNEEERRELAQLVLVDVTISAEGEPRARFAVGRAGAQHPSHLSSIVVIPLPPLTFTL